jgi:hypothetical protein
MDRGRRKSEYAPRSKHADGGKGVREWGAGIDCRGRVPAVGTSAPLQKHGPPSSATVLRPFLARLRRHFVPKIDVMMRPRADYATNHCYEGFYNPYEVKESTFTARAAAGLVKVAGSDVRSVPLPADSAPFGEHPEYVGAMIALGVWPASASLRR